MAQTGKKFQIYYRREYPLAKAGSLWQKARHPFFYFASKMLEENTRVSSAIMRNVNDVVVLASHRGDILAVSDSVKKTLGRSKESLPGRSAFTLIHPEDVPAAKNAFRAGLQNPRISALEVRADKSDGTPIWMEISGSTIRDESGNPVGVVIVARDINDRKEKEAELLKTVHELEESNKAKDRFFSIIAHDLRSPFQGLLGFSKVLLEGIKGGAPADEMEHYAQTLHDQSKNSFKLVENLLEWARLQSGRLVPRPERLELFTAIDGALLSIKAQLEEKKITADSSVPGAMAVTADRNMLSGILSNLLTNAMKFTPPGGAIKVSAHPSGGGFIEVSVADTGVGIPREKLGEIFRIDSNYQSRGTAGEIGTGLGLMIVREMVEKQGGAIWAESEEGKGATFRFTLPSA